MSDRQDSQITDAVTRASMRYGYPYRASSSVNYANRKSYIFPSGTMIKINGYEKYCLDTLIQSGLTEEDILNGYKLLPAIDYVYNGKSYRYFPSIYIPSQKRLIEVNSEYAYTSDMERIYTKLLASHLLGYQVELWVYDKTGKHLLDHPSQTRLKYLIAHGTMTKDVSTSDGSI